MSKYIKYLGVVILLTIGFLPVTSLYAASIEGEYNHNPLSIASLYMKSIEGEYNHHYKFIMGSLFIAPLHVASIEKHNGFFNSNNEIENINYSSFSLNERLELNQSMLQSGDDPNSDGSGIGTISPIGNGLWVLLILGIMYVFFLFNKGGRKLEAINSK